ncbi:thioredoxin family protein [Candidatus Bathyarchaeota archaeon]|nr:MAG: thioredoxin family protein [Candidatus Bathyarchaeota archaeon]
MPHRIVVFTDGSSLCTEIVDEIEAGKCARCQLVVYNISDHTALAEKYGVRVGPVVIIDEEVKIEGRPDIPFVCSDETYSHFKEKYPLLHELGSSDDGDT